MKNKHYIIKVLEEGHDIEAIYLLQGDSFYFVKELQSSDLEWKGKVTLIQHKRDEKHGYISTRELTPLEEEVYEL